MDGDKKGRKVEEAILERRTERRVVQLDDRCPAGFNRRCKIIASEDVRRGIRSERAVVGFCPLVLNAAESEFRWW